MSSLATPAESGPRFPEVRGVFTAKETRNTSDIFVKVLRNMAKVPNQHRTDFLTEVKYMRPADALDVARQYVTVVVEERSR